MAKDENVKELDLSRIFGSMIGDYDNIQTEYKNVWGKKKKIMIILFFFAIVPGFLYKILVWDKGKEIRIGLTNKFLENAINHLADSNKTPFSSSKAEMTTYVSESKYDIPLTGWGRMKVLGSRITGGKAAAKTIEVNSTETNKIFELLSESHLTAHLTNPRRMETDGMISKKMVIQSSAHVELGLDGMNIDVNNVKVQVEIERMVKDDSGKKRKITDTYNSFAGIIATISGKIDYKHSMLLKSKKFPGRLNKQYDFRKEFKEIEYPLASEDFNDYFNTYLKEEDGVQLRKIFKPRILFKINQVARENKNMILSSDPSNTGTVILLESRKKNDMPLYIDKTGKFFKDSDKAQEMLEVDLQPVMAVASMADVFKSTDFIK